MLVVAVALAASKPGNRARNNHPQKQPTWRVESKSLVFRERLEDVCSNREFSLDVVPFPRRAPLIGCLASELSPCAETAPRE
jgi:hypothetical protein